MYTDRLLRLTTNQGPPIASADVTTDSIDLLDPAHAALLNPNAGRDMGGGRPIYMAFSVPNGVAPGGSTFVQMRAVISTAPNLAAPILIGQYEVATIAEFRTNAVYYVPLDPQHFRSFRPQGLRYLGGQWLGSANITGANWNVEIVMDISDGGKAYRSGFAIIG